MANTEILQPDDEGVDIKKYIFLVLGHWWWFAISIFLSLTIAYLVNRYTQQVFNANCSIIVGEEKGSAGTIENMLDDLTRVRTNKRKAVVENEISILKSYKLARLALEELDFSITYIALGRRGIAEAQLYKTSPFVVIYDSQKKNRQNFPINITILSQDKYELILDEGYDIDKEMNFGENYGSPDFNFKIELRQAKDFDFKKLSVHKYYFVFNDINSLANLYSASLNVNVNNEKGAILTLNMQGFVRDQLSDYLNKISEIYIRTNLDEKNIAAENTIKFIDDQLSGIVDSLESTGLRLQNFRTSNKVIDLSKEGTFLFQKMQDLQSERALLEVHSNYYTYLLDYIQKKDVLDDVVAPSVIGIQDNLLNSLVIDLNILLTQKRQISYSARENTPQVIILNSQIESTKKNLIENLNSLKETNEIAIKNLQKSLDKIDGEVQKLPSTEKQLIDIQRKFTINDQIYTFLLQKRAEAGITRASNTSDHKILDIARTENAIMVKPKISVNYMIGLVLGGAFPLILLLLFEFFNIRITDRNYLERKLRVPIIGNIGHNEANSELPVYSNPNSSMAESFRSIRSNLQFILKDPEAKVIAVSSAVSGEGKTYCSVNLASIFALAGKKTLIVSLDLRRPKVHRIFNIENKEGISNYLIGQIEYEKIFRETNVKNLTLVTAGPIPPNPAELIGLDRMDQFIARAKKEFDYIIIDTPPIGIVTDALTLKNSLNAFIFVIRHNYSNRQVIDLINNLNDRSLFENTCVVVNDIQLKGYYGYSYRYEYSYTYNSGYGAGREYYSDEENLKQSVFQNLLKKIGFNA